MHYDLLSILYHCYKRDDYSYIEKIRDKISSSGVKGIIANLYFMNEKEMQEEFGSYYEEIDVVKMFSKATQLFKKYFKIPVIFSIEGCDYIKDTLELEELYNLGLRNILLVWNHTNKYGGGTYGIGGLTDKGKEFLKKAVELGISIDLSHMNEETFFDTVNYLKEEKFSKKPLVIVSHSNSSSIYKHPRNLSDNELEALKGLGAIVGCVLYLPFIGDGEEMYLEHLRKVISVLGIDSVGISTYDMSFACDLFGEEASKMLYKYEELTNKLNDLFSETFTEEEKKKILYENIFNKLFIERRN